MKAEFINPFIVSLKNVVGTMAHINLDSHKPQKKSDELARGNVSGIVGMLGPQVNGSLAVSFDSRLAISITRSLVGHNTGEIDQEVCDMVGEITNMVCGGAKNLLSEQSYEFELARPQVVSGEKHIIHHKVDGPKLILTFTSEFGNAYLEICFG